jgi:tetratricopeptide (TPR) repeat protein
VLLFSSAAYHLGQPEEAIAPLSRIGTLASALGDAALQRVAMNNLGNCHLSAGDLARARRVWAECDAGFDDEPPQERVATAFNLSLAAHYAGRHDEAMRLSEAAEAMERSATPRAGRLLLILVRRGWMWCSRGEAAPARAALRAARGVAVEARLPVWERLCVAHEGKLALVEGRPERAAALLARGIHACAAGADPWDLLDLRLWLVHARLAWDRDGASAREALAELLAMPLPAWRHEHARILELAGASLLAGGRIEPAARAMAQAGALRRQQGIRRFPFEEGLARRTRAALRAQQRVGALPPDDSAGAPDDGLAWLVTAWD